AAALLHEAMDQPGGGGARRDLVRRRLADQHPPELGIEHDAAALGTHDDLEPGAVALRADIEAAAAYQRVAGDQRDVQHHLERRLAHPRLVHHPAELDAALAAEQALDRGACLARVDAVAEAAGGAEGEAEELEL